ncbi:MAG: VWA domain-containing protein [Actinobacteria bacterium]|nr:VWA domain-containing protein [Actinomycetota bacterium]
MLGNNKFKKSKITYGLIIIFVFITGVVFFALNSFVFAQGTESSSQQLSQESEQIVIKDIDTKKYPEINIYLNFKAGSLLGLSSLDKSNFTITENNEPVKNFDFAKIGEINEPAGIVLVLDASGSMKGSPIIDAINAANTFIDEMGGSDRIAVIGFSDKAIVYSNFSSNKQQLKDSISHVAAAGETALFDGIIKGLDQFNNSDEINHRYLIVLSDGKDTASFSDVGEVVQKSKEKNVIVYSIALLSKDFDPKDISQISKETGGELLTTANSQDLAGFYSLISQKIRNQYKISFKSTKPRTENIDIGIAINKSNINDSIKITYPNPFYTYSASKVIGDPLADTRYAFAGIWWFKSVIFALVFVSVTLLIYLISTIMVRNKKGLKSRIDSYANSATGKNLEAELAEKEKKKSTLSRLSGFISKISSGRRFGELFDQKLKRAGMSLKGTEFIFIHITLVIISTLVTFLLTKNISLMLMIVMVVIFFPFLFINFKTGQRLKKFNEQLPDTLQLIEGALKAGYSLNQSLAMVIEETKPPISEEFKITLSEIRIGLPEKEALENMATRINSELFSWVVKAINIQREVGGNLAEIMDIIANTIRERDRVLRQIRALVSEGKLSAYVLIGLPICIAIILSIINKSYISVLVTTKMGMGMLALAIVLMIVGIMWILRIIKIEY